MIGEVEGDPDQPPPTLTGDPHDDYNAPKYVSTTFRHSGWHRTRSRVYAALQRTHQSKTRLIAFANCGNTYHVLRCVAEPSRFRLAAHACHDRFCMVCGGERSRSIATNVKAFLDKGACRFVTLTLRNTGEPLAKQLDRLYAAFKELRKSECWRKSQAGGVAFLEVKRSEKTNLWHPHLHVLTQGRFINQAHLSTTWKAITGDSHIVDVRLVRENAQAIAYVSKYASKPMDRTVTETEATLDEAITALAGRRLVTTFGKWRGLKVTSKPDKDAWTNEGTLEQWVKRALDGDHEAESTVRALTGTWADHWLNAVRRKNGYTQSAAGPPPETLDFVDLDPIPF